MRTGAKSSGAALSAGILLAGLPAVAQAPSPVLLSRYLDTTAAQTEGRAATARNAPSGSGIRQAWNTEVSAATSEQVSAVSFTLSGQWQTFRATVGRDDSDTARGPGLAYFEVWGDGRMIARSGAMESARHPVRIGLGAGLRVRRGFQEIEAPLRGVSRLRLVTRYASDIEQQAPQVQQARGCVWGDVQVIPAPGPDGVGATIADPLRDALRLGVLRLAMSSALAVRQEAGASDEPDLRLPLKTGVVPFKVEIAGRDEGQSRVGESLIRAALGELLTGARVQSGPAFAPLDARQVKSLAQVRPAGDDAEQNATNARMGKRAGADLIVSGVWVPGQSVRLTATLVRTGKAIAAVLVPVAAP